jgi:phosphatidylserine decarboxylase
MPLIVFLLGAMIILIIIFILFLMNFYRDPKRVIPKGNNIVSPADGRVISIIDTTKTNLTIKKGFLGKINTLSKDVGKNCYVVSIFMSPLDVHINRAPIQGAVTSIKHSKGKFFKAYDLEKSFLNEKNEIVFQKGKLKIKVIQIAGFLARRIICRVKLNQKVNKGQKIGLIALGSQATVIMPNGIKLKVSLNEKVKAGESIIASTR